MRKTLIFGAALAALAIAGCKPEPANLMAGTTAGLVKGIYPLDKCTKPVPPEPGGHDIGVVNIILPSVFNQQGVVRAVNSYAKPDFLPDDPDPKPNPAPHGNGANDPPAHAKSGLPYDVYMQTSEFAKDAKGMVLVRVLLMQGGKGWSFYDNGVFHGVGKTDQMPANVACQPASPITDPSGTGSSIAKIAYFYVDIDAWRTSAKGGDLPFVIGLTFPDAGNTPVFIDPAIHPWDGFPLAVAGPS